MLEMGMVRLRGATRECDAVGSISGTLPTPLLVSYRLRRTAGNHASPGHQCPMVAVVPPARRHLVLEVSEVVQHGILLQLVEEELSEADPQPDFDGTATEVLHLEDDRPHGPTGMDGT